MKADASCIRRATTYWTTCACEDCHLERYRKRKQFSTGEPWRIPHDRAAAILTARLDDGWTSRAIASATELRPAYFQRHVTAHKRVEDMPRIGPVLAAALLTIGTPTAGQIGATGTRRRLQALAVLGHSLNDTADQSGVGFSTLAMIRNNQTMRVAAKNANAIQRVADQTGEIIGGHWVVRRDALAKKWLPLMAWDDIDDPSENPWRRDNRPDPVVVQRILAGDWALARTATKAERQEVVAGWRGGANELERLTGWRPTRYRKEVA